MTKSHHWRIDQIDRLQRMLTDNKDALCAAFYQDFGKPPILLLLDLAIVVLATGNPVILKPANPVSRDCNAAPKSIHRVTRPTAAAKHEHIQQNLPPLMPSGVAMSRNGARQGA